ncbi:hypothetical protein BCR36DRAFT_583928 [Piromyces finnis]|uniref:Uncharacterized protein n=1 Tax=Piromyces finnis TaxID=1754191 RepID=A0A1Y1V8U5_9FUNG|nr:hypothetical protein BCR36DRAFT_583928 [Piromyces finnis]|eukprot:ORX49334.1 hypothetical protein BCR36DRAFT_583928 [Piromyces finnis]
MKNLGNIKSPKNNDLEEPNDIKLENQERIDLYLNRSIEDVNRMIYDKNFGNENVPNYNSDNFIINTRLNFNDEDIEKNPSPH